MTAAAMDRGMGTLAISAHPVSQHVCAVCVCARRVEYCTHSARFGVWAVGQTKSRPLGRVDDDDEHAHTQQHAIVVCAVPFIAGLQWLAHR